MRALLAPARVDRHPRRPEDEPLREGPLRRDLRRGRLRQRDRLALPPVAEQDAELPARPRRAAPLPEGPERPAAVEPALRAARGVHARDLGDEQAARGLHEARQRDVRRARSSSTTEPTAGAPMGDVWEIGVIAPVARERTGYPSQKPEALLERLMAALSAPGRSRARPLRRQRDDPRRRRQAGAAFRRYRCRATVAIETIRKRFERFETRREAKVTSGEACAIAPQTLSRHSLAGLAQTARGHSSSLLPTMTLSSKQLASIALVIALGVIGMMARERGHASVRGTAHHHRGSRSRRGILVAGGGGASLGARWARRRHPASFGGRAPERARRGGPPRSRGCTRSSARWPSGSQKHETELETQTGGPPGDRADSRGGDPSPQRRGRRCSSRRPTRRRSSSRT